ncbi:helix-turn-helix transcriptional regulator [Niveispirillum cyanobacteriorum]|uniref:Uncharacterized protein n=1 Tax=Niveispirillum cyanobacteriorum TaxID=1612173 RepID=A0A2K9NJM8_9PROT|nr:helix-turn-helix transcriptional regulator [Niveispirillum cyanobacteriorum]AUN33297.1 hypothetical protein C0V82_23280 [Niveispirillum cyanobacteriorum]GGE49879.1 hypothetical protein GCM10011317_05350 [Niveispirillum cyanobacteriorum]
MSFRSKIDKRRQTYIRLLGEIAHALNKALEEEHAQRGLTQADIARVLGKQKSFVSRKLSGDTNMTLETLADLAYALNRPVRVTLPSREPAVGQNFSQRFPVGGTVAQTPARATAPAAETAVKTGIVHRAYWSTPAMKVAVHA